MLLDGVDDLGDHEVDALFGIGHGDDRGERVAIGELQLQPVFLEFVGDELTFGTRAGQGQHDLGRVVHQQPR